MKTKVKKKRIAVTGLSGVVGQIFLKITDSNYEIIDLYRSKKTINRRISLHKRFNLLDKSNISKTLKQVSPDVILHMAAITHIDKCEKDKKNGKKGIVWKTNVEGTDEIAKFSAKNKIPMIFLSTECVFDGKKEFFKENSKKNPINWYGKTKSEAEDRIILSHARSAILRSVVAYHENDKAKTIYGKFLNELKKKKTLPAVSDQTFTPTYTYDIARAIKKLIDSNLSGIFHLSSKKALSPYDFAILVAKKNKIPTSFVKKTTIVDYYGREKAGLRLRNSSLSGTKTDRILKISPLSPKEVI